MWSLWMAMYLTHEEDTLKDASVLSKDSKWLDLVNTIHAMLRWSHWERTQEGGGWNGTESITLTIALVTASSSRKHWLLSSNDRKELKPGLTFNGKTFCSTVSLLMPCSLQIMLEEFRHFSGQLDCVPESGSSGLAILC